MAPTITFTMTRKVKQRGTHKETFIETTTKERPWQKKYSKVIVPIPKEEHRDQPHS